MKESELFNPVKELFTEKGYKVNAEVRDCDMTAVKDNELIIIELKKNLSVTLLAQALDRQKTGALVFVAVPNPKKYSPKKFRDTLYVIKKLELGLIFVSLRGKYSFAEIIQEPEEFIPVSKRYAERKKIISEISGRTIDTNTGGVNGTKIATAFTEKCIHIACILKLYGPLSPSRVRMLGADETSGAILYRNTYKWFDRPEKGVYCINEKCIEDLKAYPQLTKYYTSVILSRQSENSVSKDE